MSVWIPIVGVMAVIAICWLLGIVKKNATPPARYSRKKAVNDQRAVSSRNCVPRVAVEVVRVEHEPSPVERAMMDRESELRKQATAYERQKKYDMAVKSMRAARKQQYETSLWYDIKTLLRIPDYLILAGRYQEAIDEANDLLAGKWKYREMQDAGFAATAKSWIHETIAEAAEKMGNSAAATKSRKSADSALAKIAVARRAQAEKEWRKNLSETGFDLAQISDCCDCAFADPCAAWHGRIISVFGKTPGFPALADLDTETIFGGELGHRLDYVNEAFDDAEIALQKAHPVRDFSPEGLRRNLYEIDIDRYVRKGKSRAAAVVAVARDRLEREIRVGLVVETKGIMDALTDAQVLAMCPNGVPPTFEPFKATKKEIREGAHESYQGGVVTIRRDGITAERIRAVCGL